MPVQFRWRILSGNFPRTVTLAWNANPETDLARYNLYIGTSSGPPYTAAGSPVTLGLVTSTTYQINTAGTYYFALKARNTSSLESVSYSNEISIAV